MKSWMWPWAAVYAAQVVVAMLVWNLVNVRGGGWIGGFVSAAIFSLPMVALWRAKHRFTTQDSAVEMSDSGPLADA